MLAGFACTGFPFHRAVVSGIGHPQRQPGPPGRPAGRQRRALATDSDWTWWRADGSYHRCFYVSDWPQLALHADWLNGLLAWAGAVRSVTVVMEPVSPRASRAAIKTQSP